MVAEPTDEDIYPFSKLEHPEYVVAKLREASVLLGFAHQRASESENERTGLNGAVRETIFGVNTVIESLASMIEDGRFNV